MSKKSAQITRLPTPTADAKRSSRDPEAKSQPVPAAAIPSSDAIEAAIEAAAEPGADSGIQVIEADVDGRRVRIVAKDEIVLECGQASVTLRRNGRIIIRGTYVETHSEGTNRIKGGQVRIN